MARKRLVPISASLALLAGCNDTTQPRFTPAAPLKHTLADMVCVSSHMPFGDDADAKARRSFELQVLKDAGIRCLRTDFFWYLVEPARGELQLDRYVRGVSEAAAHGIEVMPILTGAPAWAQRVTGEDSSIDAADYAAYASAVATRMRGRIRDYELWNEPNWFFWSPEPDPAAYAALARAAAAAIRSADPEARVVLGGNLALAEMLAGRWWGFLEDLAAVAPDIGNHFDILSYHPYTWLQQAPPEHSDGTAREPSLPELTAALRAWEANLTPAQQRPLYNTETGWSTHLVSKAEQAAFILRSLLISAGLGVRRYYVFTTFDDDPTLSVPLQAELWYGLLTYDSDPSDAMPAAEKPAFSGMRHLLKALGELRPITDAALTRIPNADGVFRIGFSDGAARLAQVVWRTDEDELAIDIPVFPGWSFVEARDLLADRVVSSASGAVTGGDRPVILTWHAPLTDVAR